jgi:two-component system, NtrC family, sensor kinase
VSEATLLVIQGPDQGRRFEIGPQPVHLGRGAQNDVRILDTEISRQHAVISCDEQGRWRIIDLNSSNGTFVNGKATPQTELEQGDQIQLGRTILLFSPEPIESSSGSAVERINLVPHSRSDDQARIVGQAGSLGTAPLSGWAQAGANLQILYQITEESVRPTSSLDELLKRILDLTLQAVGADRGCMLVTDSKTDRIEPRVVSHRPGVDVNERMPISTSIVEYVIEKGQGVRTSDAQHDSRFDAGKSIIQSGIREAMCVPMQGRYELMGVIYVDTTIAGHLAAGVAGEFNDQLLRLLLAIGRQSALAIENYRYQDALVTAERLAAVGQTIAILSHHIKNILQGVQGGSYLIDQGLKEQNNELVRKGWSIVERNQERIYHLIMDMLTFSKERQPKVELAEVRSVIEDVCELMQSRIADRTIHLSTAIAEGIPPAMFDPEGMHRAVLNIVTNAIDALDGRDAPRIEIRSGFDPEREQLWIEIEDNGPGIDAEILPRLFSLFESSKGGRGTGLGLAVSRKILQEHGGDISVKTEPEVGTCFRLQWPYLSEEPDHETEATQATQAE